jgi:putative redox protein
MKVKISHQPAYRFTATNEENNTVNMDASPSIGGEGTGFRPMEILLAGLGGCSGIDVVNILQKKKQAFDKFEVEINGHRDANEVPSLFKDIEVEFRIEGNDIQNEKIISAVQLSMDKYCSVAKTLEKTATIRYTILVNNNRIYPN